MLLERLENFRLPAFLLAGLPVCVPAGLLACLFVCLLACLPVCLPACVSLSVCLAVCLSVCCLSVFLLVGLSVFLYVAVVRLDGAWARVYWYGSFLPLPSEDRGCLLDERVTPPSR